MPQQIASSAFVQKLALLMQAAKECADEHERVAGPNRCTQVVRMRLVEADKIMTESGMASVLESLSKLAL